MKNRIAQLDVHITGNVQSTILEWLRETVEMETVNNVWETSALNFIHVVL